MQVCCDAFFFRLNYPETNSSTVRFSQEFRGGVGGGVGSEKLESFDLYPRLQPLSPLISEAGAHFPHFLRIWENVTNLMEKLINQVTCFSLLLTLGDADLEESVLHILAKLYYE